MTSDVNLNGNARSSSDVFGDLPEALINDLLTAAPGVTELARSAVDSRIAERADPRTRAQQLGLIHQIDIFDDIGQYSVAAVDGSYAIRRLAAFELGAAAALAVDGIETDIDKSEIKHDFEVVITEKLQDTSVITRGLMFCMEVDVASSIKRDLVMFDGAFSSAAVGISLAIQSAHQMSSSQAGSELVDALFNRWTDTTMLRLPEILSSDRIIALPKRSSANEFSSQTPLFGRREVDLGGKAIASLILEAGEYTNPFNLETHTIYFASDQYRQFFSELRSQFADIRVIYFKPHDWSHALRVEMSSAIADDRRRRETVLGVLQRQSVNPAMMEPYPLYTADRFVKSLRQSVNALLESVKRDVIAKSDTPEIAIDMLNSYRTDASTEEPET